MMKLWLKAGVLPAVLARYNTPLVAQEEAVGIILDPISIGIGDTLRRLRVGVLLEHKAVFPTSISINERYWIDFTQRGNEYTIILLIP
jgi:hypothetical protein